MRKALLLIADRLELIAGEMGRSAPKTAETFGCIKALTVTSHEIKNILNDMDVAEVDELEVAVKAAMSTHVKDMVSLEVGKLLGEPKKPNKSKGKQKS